MIDTSDADIVKSTFKKSYCAPFFIFSLCWAYFDSLSLELELPVSFAIVVVSASFLLGTADATS
jgi:hypothetical protein